MPLNPFQQERVEVHFFNAVSIAQATLGFLWQAALPDNVSSKACAPERNSELSAPAELTYFHLVSAASSLLQLYTTCFFYGLDGVQEKAKNALACVVFS